MGYVGLWMEGEGLVVRNEVDMFRKCVACKRSLLGSEGGGE